MQTKKKLVTAACLLIVLMGACNGKSGHEVESSSASVTKVTVAEARQMEYRPVFDFTGTAEPYKEANLGASIPGRVEKIHYAKGSYVPKGAVIVEMSDELLIQAQIEMQTLRKDFERIARLKEKESISVMDYDHVKAKYEASQAKVEMLKKNTSIVAPFSGVITDIMVNEGENYTFVPSVRNDLKIVGGIVSLKQLNPLKVSISVNEKQLHAVTKGEEVRFVFDAAPDAPVTGKVSYIAPVLSSMTRTVTVEVTIPNHQLRLKPGMFCRASLYAAPQTGVFVPLNAISRQQGTGDEYLFVVNEELTVSRRKITRGEVENGYVRVPEVNAGERVVVDGKNRLIDGLVVEIIQK